MILLTPQEILEVWHESGRGDTWGEYAEALNKAQLQKLAKWLEIELESLCRWDLEWEWMSPQDDGEYIQYQDALDLLTALLKEVG